MPLRLEVIASLQYTNGFSASFGFADNCLKLIRKGYILHVFLNNSPCRQLMMHCYSVGWLVGWLVTGRAVKFPPIHLSYWDTHCMCVGEINKATELNINNVSVCSVSAEYLQIFPPDRMECSLEITDLLII